MRRFIAALVLGAFSIGTQAAQFNVRLIEVKATVSDSELIAVLNSDGGNWTWNDVALTVTSSTTYDTQYSDGLHPIVRHIADGYVVDASGPSATAQATSFECVEGTFGGIVSTNICAGISFGPNLIYESSATWGPGLAFSRQLNSNPIFGGDDFIFGDQSNLNGLFDGMSVTGWDGQTLVVGNVVPMTSGYQLTYQLIPIPATVWLFGSALGLLGWMRRKTA